jgi:hypothetical protein
VAVKAPSVGRQRSGGKAEPRWPMAVAILACGVLRLALPKELRAGEAPWLMLLVVGVLLGVLMIGDPGRIDRDSTWLRAMTGSLIGLITLANSVAAVRLVASIISTAPFTSDANVLLEAGGAVWATNLVVFGLWFWDLDRGGAAARARGTSTRPAFLFPEMTNPDFVRPNWYPKFVDYLHLSFSTATAFSPTDVSPIKSWAKLMMLVEDAISLIVALLVVARAVNILK